MKLGIKIPKHRVHKYADLLFFGKSFPEVHEAIDLPYLLLGRKHRIWFHTPFEAYLMGSLASSDPRGGSAGLLHTWVDQACSKDKHFKKWLEYAAHQDYRDQQQIRRFARQLKKRKRKPKPLLQTLRMPRTHKRRSRFQLHIP